jgi:hypothetical protein
VRGAIISDCALGTDHLRAKILKPLLKKPARPMRRLGLRSDLPRYIIVDQRIGDLRRLHRRGALERNADRIGEPVALHRQPVQQRTDRALAPDQVGLRRRLALSGRLVERRVAFELQPIDHPPDEFGRAQDLHLGIDRRRIGIGRRDHRIDLDHLLGRPLKRDLRGGEVARFGGEIGGRGDDDRRGHRRT